MSGHMANVSGYCDTIALVLMKDWFYILRKRLISAFETTSYSWVSLNEAWNLNRMNPFINNTQSEYFNSNNLFE